MEGWMSGWMEQAGGGPAPGRVPSCPRSERRPTSHPIIHASARSQACGRVHRIHSWPPRRLGPGPRPGSHSHHTRSRSSRQGGAGGGVWVRGSGVGGGAGAATRKELSGRSHDLTMIYTVEAPGPRILPAHDPRLCSPVQGGTALAIPDCQLPIADWGTGWLDNWMIGWGDGWSRTQGRGSSNVERPTSNVQRRTPNT